MTTYYFDRNNYNPTNAQIQKAFLEWLVFTINNNPELPVNQKRAEELNTKYEQLLLLKNSYIAWADFIKKNDMSIPENLDQAGNLYKKYQMIKDNKVIEKNINTK